MWETQPHGAHATYKVKNNRFNGKCCDCVNVLLFFSTVK